MKGISIVWGEKLYLGDIKIKASFRNTNLILLKGLVEQAAPILIPVTTIKVPRGL